MLRKRLAGGLAFATLIAALSSAPLYAAGPVVTPLDLNDCGLPPHWASPFVCDLQHHGILLKGSFDEQVTRGEFLTLLRQALGYIPKADAAAAILPGGFDPAYRANQPITREDAVTLVTLAVGGSAEADLRVLEKTPDANLISAHARQPLAFAMLHGVIQGHPGGAVDPKSPLTWGAAGKILSLAVPESVPTDLEKITILSYNDFHGHLLQDAKQRAGQDLGAERLTTAIAGQRLKSPKLLLLDAGDTFQGTPISNLVNGESVQEWRNLVGVQAATLGNHEFDWSRETMRKLMQTAKLPVVSANIFKAGTETRPDWLTPSTMLQAGAYKVGIIGITTLQTKVTTLPAHVADLDFGDPAPIINAESKRLRAQGADLIVVMIHATTSPGRTDKAKVEGDTAEWMKTVTERVDAIVGGHSHQYAAGHVLNARGEQVPVVQAGSYGRALGRIDLYVQKSTRSLVRAIPAYLEPAQSLPATPAVTDLITRWTAQVKPIESQKVGRILRPISRNTTNAGESALGDLIADGMLTAAPGIQIALMNGGGIRASLEGDAATGDVTWGQWYTIQPFGNTLVTVEMTGAQVKTALEQGVESYVKLLKNESGGHQPTQVAGISFTWDFARPMGERVESITLPYGSPIDMDATYKVVVNNFMATGGDDFAILKELASKQLDLGLVDLGLVDLDVSVNHFKALSEKGPVDYALQNRITVKNFPARGGK